MVEDGFGTDDVFGICCVNGDIVNAVNDGGISGVKKHGSGGIDDYEYSDVDTAAYRENYLIGYGNVDVDEYCRADYAVAALKGFLSRSSYFMSQYG